MPGVALSDALRAWYRPRRRAFPWRGSRDPYAVLVSEVMLQQTQAARVVPAFERFLALFPTVEGLASAPRSEVVRAWAGLGYNRRAIALSDAAREIERVHGGRIPRDAEVLRTLPGVGPYTAAAVASLAFGAAVPALDTNVRRVVARAKVGRDPGDVAVGEIAAAADAWIDRADPGAWNQALMDLGREICRARPRCDVCPIASDCRFLADGVTPRAPRRRQGPFAGSTRQVRGAVVDVLRERPSATLATLVARTGFEPNRVHHAVATLHAEGVLVARPAALDGRPSGVVRLAT